MRKLSFEASITFDQLLSLISQLPAGQKLELANRLKAEAIQERWNSLNTSLNKRRAYDLSMDEIVSEVKEIRKELQKPKNPSK